MPRDYYWTPVATLIITHTLAHEVGHHISSKKGYIFAPIERSNKRTDQDEEMLANRYASSVLTRMRRRWHYRVATWAIKDLAKWHDVSGVMNWKKERYNEAAEHWYKAAVLEPDNLQAAYWYWRAKEMCCDTINV